VSDAIDVALDARLGRQMSVGMKAYAVELAGRLPRIAPDLHFARFTTGANFSLQEQISLPIAIARARPRLVHFLSLYAPLLARRPYVVTIHDLIHLRFPRYFKAKYGPYYRIVVRRLCAGAACIITDDERTIADLERFLGVPPAKVRVIPLGVDDQFRVATEPEQRERPYFIYAGNHRPHKDLATLFAAWRRLPQAAEADLLLTGDDDIGDEDGGARLRGERIFLGEVGIERLARLYRGSVALVHPARCEGSGLPMVEAAAVGARVIACEDAVPAELRPHVQTFAPGNVAELSVLMAAALAGGGAAASAQAVARSLSWDRCAGATAEVYRALLADRQS